MSSKQIYQAATMNLKHLSTAPTFILKILACCCLTFPSYCASQSQEGVKNDLEVISTPAKDAELTKSTPVHTFTANISFVSDYRFRGISQTFFNPAVQGGFDYSHQSGFYLGTWGSNVDGTTHLYNNTSLEWDFYTGFKGKVFPCMLKDLNYNVGIIYYWYPGGQADNRSQNRYNTSEYYLEFVYNVLSIKLYQTITNFFGVDQQNPPFNDKKGKTDHPNGSSRGSIYIEGNLNFSFWEKWSLLIHGAHQYVHHYNQLSFTDWRVTLTYSFTWFNVFVTGVGTDAKRAYYRIPNNAYHPKKYYLGAPGVVGGIARTF
jgi:uncharacterized protein (TIGR02001 family)